MLLETAEYGTAESELKLVGMASDPDEELVMPAIMDETMELAAEKLEAAAVPEADGARVLEPAALLPACGAGAGAGAAATMAAKRDALNAILVVV